MTKKKIILKDIPKQGDAFDAPDGFFDSFYDELEEAIDAKEADSKTKKLPTVSRKAWVMVAASISILLMVGIFVWTNQNEEVLVADVLSTVSSHEIAFYLENSPLDIETLLEEVEVSLLTMDQNELMKLEDLSEEDMNTIIEQYEDLF